jgi:hypothetical protein
MRDQRQKEQQMNTVFRVISSTVIVSLFSLSAPVKAETVSTTADLLNNKKVPAYALSREMQEIMYRLGVEQDKKLGLQTDCKSQYNIKPIDMAVLSPIDFPEDKQNPTKGVWKVRYKLERCGDSKVYNAYFVANSNGEAPNPRAYYPGSTNASPVLVKDAMSSAIVGASARSGLKDCKDISVFDMRVTEPAHNFVEGEKTFKGVWNEIWTFRMCGHSVEVAMTFIPDVNGGGTTFKSGPVIHKEKMLQKISGLPILPGDSIEKVKSALNTDIEPEDYSDSNMRKNYKQLRLKTKGIWVFFDQFGRAYTIRLDTPFAGNVGGVEIGKSRAFLMETLGKPTTIIERMKTINNRSKPYLYHIDDNTNVRFDFGDDDEIITILVLN